MMMCPKCGELLIFLGVSRNLIDREIVRFYCFPCNTIYVKEVAGTFLFEEIEETHKGR